MAAANIDLVEMRDAAVAGCGGDVFKLDVHVVFGCARELLVAVSRGVLGKSTFEEFAAVDLAGC